MLTGTNNDVYKLIKGCVYGTDYFINNMRDSQGQPLPGTDREIKRICRTSYDSMKKKVALADDPVLLAQRRARSNKRSRMLRVIFVILFFFFYVTTELTFIF